MLFTRTIRRKMMTLLALVLVMLITVSLGGISGLASYRRLVKDLNSRLTDWPHSVDLCAALSKVSDVLPPLDRSERAGPLSPELLTEVGADFPFAGTARTEPPRPFLSAADQEMLGRNIENVSLELREYLLKLDALPNTDDFNGRRKFADPVLGQISAGLARLGDLQAGLRDPEHSDAAALTMRLEIGELYNLFERLPNQSQGLRKTLKDASDAYGAGFRLIGWSTVIVVALFFGLWRYAYSGIFSPLKKLHQGASRVAQGDFDYRLRLGTHDEMAELADSFNKMTARFQEITRNLDAQVRERSKQLVRSERLAGIGFLAAGVAHEINNPLSAIAMAAESMQSRIPEPCSESERSEAEVCQQYLGMIQREAFRCQQITARLLNFARGDGTTRTQSELVSLIDEVLAMVQHMSKFRDRHIVFANQKPCYAEMNGPEIKQVALNIVANALESMEPGGTLRIELIEQTDHVIMSFADDGCGMTPAVIDNLFEPFFTRRKDGKGTGLGMSISHRIVSDHGGTIEVSSAGPGLGTTFRVHLPRRAAAAEAA